MGSVHELNEDNVAEIHAMLWSEKVSIGYSEIMDMPESYFMKIVDKYYKILEDRVKQAKRQMAEARAKRG